MRDMDHIGGIGNLGAQNIIDIHGESRLRTQHESYTCQISSLADKS